MLANNFFHNHPISSALRKLFLTIVVLQKLVERALLFLAPTSFQRHNVHLRNVYLFCKQMQFLYSNLLFLQMFFHSHLHNNTIYKGNRLNPNFVLFGASLQFSHQSNCYIHYYMNHILQFQHIQFHIDHHTNQFQLLHKRR